MKRLTPLFALLSLLGVLGISACGPDSSNNSTFNNSNNNNTSNNNNAVCNEGQRVCFNNIIQLCQDGGWVNEVSCGVGSQPPICDDNGGSPICANCVSGGTTCGDDGNVHQCTADGNVGLVTLECDSALGEQCLEANGVASCDSPCIRAASNKSYRGCDYWVVSTANPQLSDLFHNNFAVVIDNSNDTSVTVTMSGPGVSKNEQIAANTVKVFELPYNLDISVAGGDTGIVESGLYRASESKGAVHVTTTLPVTVYQFNPYDYQMGGDCSVDLDYCSYSNDASLVMPTAVLSQNYIVMSRPTMSLEYFDGFMSYYDLSSPGFVTIVATQDNTTVQFASTAYTVAGSGVGALSPGGQMSYQLNKGDVLQLVTSQEPTVSNCPGETSGPDTAGHSYCNTGDNYDLTGSEITTNAPVAVWGGHACDFVPYNSWACDHLEEMIFPLETWGKEFQVGLTKKVDDTSIETNIIRIVSGDDNITVSFSPAVENPVTLNRGDWLEFLAPGDQHFSISATGPIMVGKFMVGQNYWTDDTSSMGDPAFGLVVPTAQYRSDYTFTTPQSMSLNYVNVIAQIQTDSSQYINLDGQNIQWSQFEPIGNTGYGVARMNVTNTGTNGSHSIYSSSETITFGIEVYGFANFTSYLYAGGLDLTYINPIGK